MSSLATLALLGALAGVAQAQPYHYTTGGMTVFGTMGFRESAASAAPVQSVVMGGRVTYVLRTDGTYMGIGRAQFSELEFPANAPRLKQISSGYIEESTFRIMAPTVGLKPDGTVVAWGTDWASGGNIYGILNVPAELKDPATAKVKQVVAGPGSFFALALRENGTVVGWGGVPHGTSDLTNVKQVACGGQFGVALLNDGTVVQWGFNGHMHPPSGLRGVVQVATTRGMAYALKSDGTVVGWGGDNIPVPADLKDVVQLSGGFGHMVALKRDGTVTTWGSMDSWDYSPMVEMPANLSDVKSVTAGGGMAGALKKDGSVVLWGRISSFEWCLQPEWQNAKQVALSPGAGNGHSSAAVLKENGSIDIVRTRGLYTDAPQMASLPNLRDAKQVSISYGMGAYITESGQRGLFGVPLATSFGVQPINPVAVLHSPETLHTIQADGRVTMQGLQVFWFHLADQEQPFGSNVTQMAAGDGIYYMRSSNGHVSALTNQGPLGHSFIDIPEFEGALKVVAEGGAACALMPDRTIRTRGSNDWGERNAPAGLNDIVDVAAGDRRFIALRANGTLVSWGYGNLGQTSLPSNLPVIGKIDAGGWTNLAVPAVRIWIDQAAVNYSSPGSGKITLANPAPAGGLDVYFSSDTTKLVLPVSIHFDSGDQSKPFTFTAKSVPGDLVARVRATSGAAIADAYVTVTPSAISLAAIAVSTKNFVGGTALPVTGTVRLNGTTTFDRTVTLSSSETTVGVPATVTIPAGYDSATFDVAHFAGGTDRSFTITANTSGSAAKTVEGINKLVKVSRIATLPLSVTGGATSRGTVTLSVALVHDLDVTLGSTNAAATVPATVRVPANSLTASFDVTTNAVVTDTTVSITGKVGTGTPASGPLTVRAPVLARVTAVTPMYGGWKRDFSVTLLGPAPQGGLEVQLESTDGALSVQPTLTFGVGDITKTFSATAANVSSRVDCFVKAKLGAMTPVQASVRIEPNRPSGLTFAPTAVVGGSTATVMGTVTLARVVDVDVQVSLESLTPSSATAPTFATVPAGSRTGTFPVTHFAVSAPTAAEFRVSNGGGSRDGSLVVRVNPIALVALSSTTVAGGSATTVTGTVTLEASVAADTWITLSSDITSAAQVPTQVMVPAGSSVSQPFVVTHFAVSASQRVTITASAPGSTKSAKLRVNRA